MKKKVTKYVKAEIQFWCVAKDRAIHVTTRPASALTPLHTTNGLTANRATSHRSMSRWLAAMLKAEGNAAP